MLYAMCPRGRHFFIISDSDRLLVNLLVFWKSGENLDRAHVRCPMVIRISTDEIWYLRKVIS